MGVKYETLQKEVLGFIKKIRCGDSTLDKLEEFLTNERAVPRAVIYHPTEGNKSVPVYEVAKRLKEGWYKTPADFPPDRDPELTPDQWLKCDARLEHEWGLSLASLISDVLGEDKKDPRNKEKYKPLFDKVIATYGDRIEQTERNSCLIWKLKE